MMTREDRQEALSLAYVHAVAAAAGVTHSARLKDYGIDLTLHEVIGEPGLYVESGRAIEIQLKSTTAAIETRATVSYDLSVRAYDILRAETKQTRLLVLLVLAEDEAEWLVQTGTKAELRRGLFWMSLRGRPAVPNRSSVRIQIPRRQVFTATAVREIMQWTWPAEA
jgi:hypothetical protein